MLDRGFLRPLHADIPPDFALLPNGKIEPITDRGREMDAAIAVRRSASCGGALSDAKS